MNKLTYELELIEMSEQWIDYVRQHVDFVIPEIIIKPVFGRSALVNPGRYILGEYSFGIIYLYFGDIQIFSGDQYYTNPACVRAIILEVITHELFHIDQLIDHARYCTDMEYKFSVESPVNYNVAKFLISHIDDVVSFTGGNVEDIKNFIAYNPEVNIGFYLPDIERRNREKELKDIYLQNLSVRMVINDFALDVFDNINNIALEVIYTFDVTEAECIKRTIPLVLRRLTIIKYNGVFLQPDEEIIETINYIAGTQSIENPMYEPEWLITYTYKDDTSILFTFFKVRHTEEDKGASGFLIIGGN